MGRLNRGRRKPLSRRSLDDPSSTCPDPEIPPPGNFASEFANYPQNPSHENRLVQKLPPLQPISRFSPTTGLSKVIQASGLADDASKSQKIHNSLVIEILVHLLCREREPDTALREKLVKAMCNGIYQWNQSLYVPLHSFSDIQDFRKSFIQKFEVLFGELKQQIHSQAHQSLPPSFNLPVLGSPLNQVALADSYRHHFLDDRYSREFREVGILGRGGFGSVVKAENKLDGRTYAVKLILMDKKNHNSNKKILREVQALALLDHPNIVRYHSTWLQLYVVPPDHLPEGYSLQKIRKPRPHFQAEKKTTPCAKICELSSSELEEFETSSDSIVFADQSKSEEMFSKNINVFSNLQKSGTNISGKAVQKYAQKESLFVKDSKVETVFNSFYAKRELDIFVKSEKSNQLMACYGSFKPSNMKGSLLVQNTLSSAISEKSSSSSISGASISSTPSPSNSNGHPKNSLILYEEHPRDAQMTLFIQMGLCGENLADWISRRNTRKTSIKHIQPVDVEEYLQFILQILEALIYIHSKGIVHRDLKPANIFLTSDSKRIQIGDFGLARFLQDTGPAGASNNIVSDMKNMSLAPVKNNTSAYTKSVGTLTYMPPELKSGDSFSNKSDMYNLGIIILEFFHPFQTASERLHVIRKLKEERYIDPELEKRWPQLATCIRGLTEYDQSQRPTAEELLKCLSDHYLSGSLEESVNMCVIQKSEKEYTSYVKKGSAIYVNTLDISQSEIINETSLDLQAADTTTTIAAFCKWKDEEIKKLKEENAILRQKLAKLEEQVNQNLE